MNTPLPPRLPSINPPPMGDMPSFPLEDLPPKQPPVQTLPPTASSLPPAAAAPPARAKAMFFATGALGLFALVSIVVALVSLAKRTPSSRVDDRAIVRVVTDGGSGTGFFVKSPAGVDGALVVTAFHVVDSGSPVTIERTVKTSDKDAYVEAYPETEVVAFDADQDLALVRVKNLPKDRVTTLELADKTVPDQAIVSVGYPASSLTKRLGLLKKEGKLLDVAKLPAIDRIYGRVVRESAVDGLIVSTDIEPGFSGGPTCDDSGRVLGVNVLKDTKFRGQNAAVSVDAVRELMGKVKPYAAPTPADVEALLKKTQDETLLLPVDDRTRVRAHDLIGAGELPQLRALVTELRGMETDLRHHEVKKGLSLTNQALLGILLARLPGKSLETYSATSTQEAIGRCEDTAAGLTRFFGEIGLDETGTGSPDADCGKFAMRPLAWDLLAGTLEWDGTPRTYSVTKLEEVDPDARVFLATVRMSNVASLVPVHVAFDHGRLAIKIFDKNGRLYALDGSRNAVSRDFEGVWVAKRDRHAEAAGIEAAGEERLTVTVRGTDAISVLHEFKLQRFATKPGVIFSCNVDRTVTTAGTEALAGTLHNGVIMGAGEKAELSSDGCNKCGLCMTPERVFVLKLVAGRLVLYRTSGIGKPETVEFVRG